MFKYVLTNTQYYSDIADAIRRKAATLESITIVTPPTKTAYNNGDQISYTGLVVRATYSDEFTENVTSKCTFSVSEGTVITGNTTVTISYKFKKLTKTATLNLTCNALSKIVVTTPPTKQSYTLGDTLNLSGMVITAHYTNGTTKRVTNYTTSPANGSTLSTAGTQTITVSYTEDDITKTTTLDVSIDARTIESIAVTTPPTNRTYSVGANLDLSGMVVTATYTDGTSGAITNYTVSPTSGSTLSTNGRHYIHVTVTQGNTTFEDYTFVLAGSSWTTATDAEIVSMVQRANAGSLNLHNEWNVGDERFVTLAAMGEYLNTDPSTPLTPNYYPSHQATFVLTHKAGHEYVTPTSARSKCWFEVQLTQSMTVTVKNRYNNVFYIGDDYLKTTNGWGATNRRTWCNEVFYNAIPSSLRSIFRQFKCKCAGGSASNIYTENLYFAYPALVEVCSDPSIIWANNSLSSALTPYYPTDNGYKDEGELWEYYQNTYNLRLTVTDKPYTSDRNAWRGYWMLRSPEIGTSSSWQLINDDWSEGNPVIIAFSLGAAGNLPFGVI